MSLRRKIAFAVGAIGTVLVMIGCGIVGEKATSSGAGQDYLDQANSWVRYLPVKHTCGDKGGVVDTVTVTVWNENTDGKATVLITQNTDPPKKGSDAELFRGELEPKPKKDGYRYNNFQPDLYPKSYKTVTIILPPNGPDPKHNKDDLRRAQIKIIDLHSRVKMVDPTIEVFEGKIVNECPKAKDERPQRSRAPAQNNEEAHDRRVCAEMSTKERELRCLRDRGLEPTP